MGNLALKQPLLPHFSERKVRLNTRLPLKPRESFLKVRKFSQKIFHKSEKFFIKFMNSIPP